MANYRISGVWKDSSGAISHYAMHDVTNVEKREIGAAKKTAKDEAIKIVEKTGNIVDTIVWNYTAAAWRTEERVHVVTSGNSKYLRSNADKKLTDNLGHLPNYSLIF
jgi:hypothetical protein